MTHHTSSTWCFTPKPYYSSHCTGWQLRLHRPQQLHSIPRVRVLPPVRGPPACRQPLVQRYRLSQSARTVPAARQRLEDRHGLRVRIGQPQKPCRATVCGGSAIFSSESISAPTGLSRATTPIVALLGSVPASQQEVDSMLPAGLGLTGSPQLLLTAGDSVQRCNGLGAPRPVLGGLPVMELLQHL